MITKENKLLFLRRNRWVLTVCRGCEEELPTEGVEGSGQWRAAFGGRGWGMYRGEGLVHLFRRHVRLWSACQCSC